jgi:two-component system, chemotaxis family, protein-glutamate methylesterase/glutaminase
MIGKKIKVLVVDDTIVYRKAVSDILAEMPGVEVVGVAHNGKIALSKINSLKPDLLTLDIEMPEMNGIEVLQYLQQHAPQISAIMVSTLTSEGGDMTMRALELGAYDFILKPSATNINESKQQLRTLLTPLIKAFPNRSNHRRFHAGRRPKRNGNSQSGSGAAAAAWRTKQHLPEQGLLRRSSPPVDARVNQRSSPSAFPPAVPTPWPE